MRLLGLTLGALAVAGVALSAALLGLHAPLRPTTWGVAACLPMLLACLLLAGAAAHRLSARLAREQAAAAQERALCMGMLDALDSGVALYDADDRLVLFNRHFARQYQALGGELKLGRSFEAMLREVVARGLVPEAAGNEAGWIAERLRQHAAPGAPSLRRDNGGRWWRLRERRLPGGGVVSLATDVTEHVVREQVALRQAAELRRARDEAVAASAAKSAFVANMSHEIRTPLTSIIGFAELLRGDDVDEHARRESLGTIIRNGRLLLQLISDILDLAKIEAGNVEIERLPVDLARLLRELDELVRPRAREKGLHLDIEPVGPLPARFEGDPVRIKQILLNFLGNAVKFTAEGSVTLRVRHAEGRLCLACIDTGIGMSAEQVGRLFRPFVQADVSTTRRFGGTGLGLYLSGKLAEALGASLHVDSRPGQGACFELRLPVPMDARTPLLRPEARLQDTRWRDFEVSDFPPPALSGRVLLAEDGEDTQRLLCIYLRHAGLSVTLVSDGEQAVQAALEGDIDLVLMDVQMPVLDGVQATRRLRMAGFDKPIVALTANVMKEDVQRCLAAGCNDVLAKPVDRAVFYETLGRQLGGPTGHHAQAGDIDAELAALGAEFLARVPAQAEAIGLALAQQDWRRLRQHAHTLKGVAGSLGQARLGDAAGALEQALIEGHLPRARERAEALLSVAAALAPA